MRARTVGALIALVLVTAACTDDDLVPEGRATVTPGAGRATATPRADGAAALGLFYVDRTTLLRYDLESERAEDVGALPSADAAVSPDGTRLATVQETSPQGPGPEGFREPVLLAGRPGAGELRSLGPGRAPLWSPDSRMLAGLVPDGDGERVVVFDPDTGDARPVLPDEQWSLIGWSEDAVVAASLGTGRVVSAAPDGPARELDIPLSRLWGVSPAEPTRLLIEGNSATIRRGSDDIPVDLSGPALGDGAFSFDGQWVAAVQVGAGADNILLLIDVATGDVREVPESERAQGQVVWSADSSAFAYARVKPGAPGRLEAVMCTIALDCNALFDWKEGVQLLALVTAT